MNKQVDESEVTHEDSAVNMDYCKEPKLVSLFLEIAVGIEAFNSLYWFHSSQPGRIPKFSAHTSGLVNTLPMNEYGSLKRFLKALSRALKEHHYYACCVDNFELRPRESSMRSFWSHVFKGNTQALSLMECKILLRHYGFHVADHMLIGDRTWIVAARKPESLAE